MALSAVGASASVLASLGTTRDIAHLRITPATCTGVTNNPAALRPPNGSLHPRPNIVMRQMAMCE
jgi:hypothetical protein